MNWKEMLDSVHLKALAIAAFNKEIHSLTEKNEFLRELMEDDPYYATAIREAITGRAIFDIKRDTVWTSKKSSRFFSTLPL
jgi:hypothetical protein